MKKTFAERVRELRERRGWEQKFLAEKIEVSPGYICLLESGVRDPSFATQAALAKAFGMKLSKFLEGV